MPVVATDNQPDPQPKRSSTPYTDGLRSGGNVVYDTPDGRPFWDEEADLMSGQFSGRVAPVAPVARGYLDLSDYSTDYTPPGDYTVTIPDEAGGFRAGSPAELTGKNVVPEIDYFNA